MQPKVSVIIIAYNEQKMLPLCLNSLLNLNYPKKKLEIIVVDNNSTDATKDIIERYPVKYVFESKRRRGVARNRGINESTGELIAFIDADCVADRGWLVNIIKGFTTESVGGCGGKVLSYKPETLVEKYYDFKGGLHSQERGLIGQSLFLPRIKCCNAAYRRNVLKDAGLFDDSFIAGEDTDLSWRVYLKKFQLKYIPEAIVYQKHPDRLIDFFRKLFEYGYAYTYLFQKYSGLIKKPLIGYDDWIMFFFEELQSIKSFFIALFTKNDIVENIFPIFDMIKSTVFFLGRIYGLLRLRLGIEKILPLSFLNDNIIYGTVNDETIILKIKSGFYYILNDVGNKIWRLYMQGKSIEEIIDIITNEYKADRLEVKNDLSGFIDGLKKEDLLKAI